MSIGRMHGLYLGGKSHSLLGKSRDQSQRWFHHAKSCVHYMATSINANDIHTPLIIPNQVPVDACYGETIKQLNPYKGLGGNKKLLPHRFSLVGILPEILRASSQLPLQTSSPWCPVCPPYCTNSMNHPNLTRGWPSEGVRQGQLGGVLYKSIK